MARLYLFAEGRTEQTFANTVLRPHLAHHGVYLHRAVLIANAHKKHKTHRGGGRNFPAMQKDIGRFLKQERGRDVFFTSMIDLYALHAGFPGTKETEQFRDDPYRRVEALEQWWARETNDRRFIPHIQLHEFEAYLFVDIAVLSKFYPDQQQAVTKLGEIGGAFPSPEMIDDGPTTAPSRRIVDELPRYDRDKATVGVQAVEQIGLAAIRCTCLHFSRWLERLEGLAQPNGK